MIARWRLALRVARRDARRSPGRSALIVAMIALPVIALVALDLVIQTASLDGPENARRAMGAADMLLEPASSQPIEQTPARYLNWATGDSAPEPVTVDDLPADSTFIELVRSSATVQTAAGVQEVSTTSLDSSSPIAAGLFRLDSGHWADADNEVAISPGLAERLAVGLGGTLTLVPSAEHFTVVGLAINPDDTRGDVVYARVGALPAGDGEQPSPTALVDLPDGVNAVGQVSVLNARGIAVLPRQWVLHPPPEGTDPAQTATTIGLATLITGLALLQLILLVSAAFSVGARRQRRVLGLVAATGGAPRDVGRLVLAGGVVAGLISAGLGVLIGAAAAVPLRVLVEHQGGSLLGDWHVRPWEIAAVAALGVLTGVLAALGPARAAARHDPLLALQDRPAPAGSGRRLAGLGLLIAAAGGATAWYAAVQSPVNYILILTGSGLVQIGFVLCAPGAVSLAGRSAGRFPVPMRMALRDAARNRSRSGPAVAGVMAALAGCVALSTYFVSSDAQAKATYIPVALPGQITLSAYSVDTGSGMIGPDTLTEVSGDLGGAAVVPLRQPSGACASSECAVSLFLADASAYGPAVIGDATVLRALIGRTDAAAEQALAAGRAVVLDPSAVQAGAATFLRSDVRTTGAPDELSLPAYGVQTGSTYLPSAVLPAALAASQGLTDEGEVSYLIDTTHTPTTAELERLQHTLLPVANAYYEVEEGYVSPNGPVLLALLGISAVVVLGATAISTGLAAAEGRGDLATLAAVGASPRTRRLLAVSQAASVSFIGAAMGAVAGSIPAAAVIAGTRGLDLTIPWSTLAGVVLGVPVLAALCAGLFTRSRLPMLRRIA